MTTADLTFPQSLYPKIRQMRWTPEDSSGAVSSPWTGHTQAVPGMLQRWVFTAEFHPLSQEDAGILQGFVASCQGPVKTFSFWDPVRWRPLGQWIGNPVPVVDGDHGARSGTLRLRGFRQELYRAVAAGDWISVNGQLCAALKDVSLMTEGTIYDPGTVTLEIFPRLMRPVPDGAAVQWLRAPGIFRLQGGAPTFTATAGHPKAPYSIQQLSGVQEILL